MKAQQINTAALTAEVRHLGRGLAQAVRARQPMPPALLPDLEAQPLHVQISTIWRAYLSYTYRDPRREDDTGVVERYRAIARLYGQLGERGYHLNNARGLKERHVRVLLQLWREQGKKPSTIRSRWSILRMWMLALGRAGVIGPIEQYWPDIPKQEDGTAIGGNPRDKVLSEAQMTELMRASDLTHWYVECLHQELGLTVQEALAFDSQMATKALTGRMMVRSSSGEGGWMVAASSQAQVTLVQKVETFMAERGRGHLMWPNMTLSSALKRHYNRLAYLRRKFPAGAPSGEPAVDDFRGTGPTHSIDQTGGAR